MTHVQGNLLVPIALYAWIPAVLALFALLPPRRAVIVAFLAAWLFLPMAGIAIAGLPDYTKMTATCFGIVLAASIFDADRLLSFRPRLIDLPMALWILSPLFASLSNNLGVYDGTSETFKLLVVWGLPYYIGRVYFTNFLEARELAVGIFVGGLIYVPLCLWEIRMSPHLHYLVYGFQQHSFAQTYRRLFFLDGFRPIVFMQHGLMVGMWMTATTLIGLWLWLSGSLRQVRHIPVTWLLVPLTITTILCKSTGALLLLGAGVGVLIVVRYLRIGLPVLCLVLIPLVYMYARASGFVSVDQIVPVVKSTFGDQRAESIEMRLKNEDSLTARALLQPVFGWGGWGRARVTNEEGRDISITDGLWVIALGNTGLFGLSAITAMLLLPIVVLWWRCPARFWLHPAIAPVVALALLLVLYMLDNLMNAMINPIFILGMGAVVNTARQMKYVPELRQAHRRRAEPLTRPVTANQGRRISP